MFVLALIVCLSDRCSRVELQVDSCSAGGQAAAAQWLAERPDMRLERLVSCASGKAA